MKLPKILKSRRGVALENAILFMILLFSLCALLTTLTVIGHNRLKLENNAQLRNAEIDQIGEDYIYSLKSGDDSLSKYIGKYYYEIIEENNVSALTVWGGTDKETDSVILYIEAEKTVDGNGNETVSIKQWRYSLNE